MSRKEDFFNEATKQIRDSYVFQNDETYSDDDVRDIATSLAEFAYKYAIDKFCELLEKNMFEKYDFDEYGNVTQTYACSDNCEYVSEFVEQIRKLMEEAV